MTPLSKNASIAGLLYILSSLLRGLQHVSLLEREVAWPGVIMRAAWG
jgi:hypothetical protein